VRLLPGDPARVIAGLQASEQEVDRIREQLGLEQPLLAQFGLFLENLAQGNMGTSARTGNPVVSEIWPGCRSRSSSPSWGRPWVP
jgi:peptide/nickel transport system permease protein